MSNYSQITNFTPKDSLPSGNPSKVIMGADFDGEFNAISTAIATKADSSTVSALSSTVSSLSSTVTTLDTEVDGKVTGPVSSTDNTLPRFDGTTGKLIQGSGVVVDDSNNLSGVGMINGSSLVANVKSFGATGDGVTDDTTALQNAINSLTTGGVLDFDGVYNLGTNAGATTLTRLTVAVSGVTLRFSERTKFLIKSDAAITQVFVFAGVSNVRTIGTLRVESNASTPYSSFGSYGAKALSILNANGVTCGDIFVDAVHLTRGSGGVFVANAYAGSNRVSGITIGSIETVDATYGFNAQNNGDDVTIGMVRTYGAHRSYFAYGAARHKATVHAFDMAASGTPINVTEYSVAEGGSGIHTANMDFDLLISGGSPSCCLTVRHIGDGGASQIISDIKVRCITATIPSVGVEFFNYATSGGGIVSTSFAATARNISFETMSPSSVFTTPIDYSNCQWTNRPSVVWSGYESRFGLRNKVINGAMAVAQRGTSLATPASGSYTLDRWMVSWSGAAPASVTQVAGTGGFKSALRITGAASNTGVNVLQRIESANTVDLVGQTVTISARLVSSTAQTVAWVLNYPNAVDNYSGSSFVASGTWSVTTSATTFQAVVTNLPAGVANGLQLTFWAQNTAPFTSGTLDITGVQLEVGSVATPFEHRPYGMELALCQRYYYRVTMTTSASTFGPFASYITNSYGFLYTTFPVPMRVAPSSLEQSGTPGDYQIFVTGVNTACNFSPSFGNATPMNTISVIYATSGHTAGQAGHVSSVAGTTPYLGWSAEL